MLTVVLRIITMKEPPNRRHISNGVIGCLAVALVSPRDTDSRQWGLLRDHKNV